MSSEWDVEIANQFRKRDNIEPVCAVLGDLISIDPLKISIYNNQVILTKEQCYICSSLNSKKENIILDSVADHGSITTTCTINDILNVGDKLLCLPTTDGQTFFIIDKVVV